MSQQETEAVIARYKALEQPLLDELAATGLHAKSSYHIESAHPNYVSAVGVLLKHLRLSYPPAIRAAIAAALASPNAKPLAWNELRKLYLEEPNLPQERAPGEIGFLSEPKDQMARALAEMSGKADLEDLVSLISDPRNGPSRIFFVSALRRTRSPEAIDVLGRLAEDPDLSKEIAHSLSKYLRAKALQSKN